MEFNVQRSTSQQVPERLTKLLDAIVFIGKKTAAESIGGGKDVPSLQICFSDETTPKYQRSTIIARPVGYINPIIRNMLSERFTKKVEVSTLAVTEVVKEQKQQFETQTKEVVALAEMLRRSVSISWNDYHDKGVGNTTPVAFEQVNAGGKVTSKTRHYYEASIHTDGTLSVTYRDIALLPQDAYDFLQSAKFPV